MMKWSDLIGRRVDHPLSDAAAAKKVLADLPQDPAHALDDVATWLGSVTGTQGFRLADRIAVVKLLDEAAQAAEPKLIHSYLNPVGITEAARLQLWHRALDFWERLADAYQACIAEILQDEKHARAHAEEIALLLVRRLRALSNVMRVQALRYLPARGKLWHALFETFRLAEAAGRDIGRLKAYAADALPTSPRQELLRALMLDVAAPETMQPRHIEIAARVAARFSDAFLFKNQPGPGCDWTVDLENPRRPQHVDTAGAAGKTSCYFGGGVVLERMQAVVQRMESDPREEERRFGKEFPAEERFLVLKHLESYWGDHPPHRHHQRHVESAELTVAQGYADATHTVPRVEFSGMAELSDSMDVKFNQKLQLTLAQEQKLVQTEKWLERDASEWGLGVEVPRTSESWLRVGVLATLKDSTDGCRIGVVRRIYRDEQNHEHAGIEILAKKPVSVWVRAVGRGAANAENWATSSGSFAYDYMNVLLLNDSAAGDKRLELLMASGQYHPRVIYEVMMGSAPRYLRIEEVLEAGEDFDRVRFNWARPRPKSEKPRD
jgi:hypothetical protein